PSKPPRSLGNPPVRALLSDPGGIAAPDHRALCPTLRRSAVAFRYFDAVGSRDTPRFEAQSHGPHARCLRFVTTVARDAARPRKTRFRLVVLPGRTGFEPAGSLREVSALSSTWRPLPPCFSWR